MKIVLSVVLAMLIAGCSDEKGAQQNSAQKSVEKVATVAQTKEVAAPKEEAAPEVQAVKTQTKEVVTTVKKKVEKKIEKTVAKVAEVAKAAPVANNASGAKLFTVCSSCHGAHAEKKALGKSQIIQGWDESKTITALQGYKDGTYGGAMKAIMKGQAAKLSDTDIKALAKYISNL